MSTMVLDVSKDDREEDVDLVVKDRVVEVVQEMVMCRCGWGGESLLDIALLPCRRNRFQDFDALKSSSSCRVHARCRW